MPLTVRRSTARINDRRHRVAEVMGRRRTRAPPPAADAVDRAPRRVRTAGPRSWGRRCRGRPALRALEPADRGAGVRAVVAGLAQVQPSLDPPDGGARAAVVQRTRPGDVATELVVMRIGRAEDLGDPDPAVDDDGADADLGVVAVQDVRAVRRALHEGHVHGEGVRAVADVLADPAPVRDVGREVRVVVQHVPVGHPVRLRAGHAHQRAADGQPRDAPGGAGVVQLRGEGVLDRGGTGRGCLTAPVSSATSTSVRVPSSAVAVRRAPSRWAGAAWGAVSREGAWSTGGRLRSGVDAGGSLLRRRRSRRATTGPIG